MLLFWQEYWIRLSFPPLGDLPNTGIKPMFPVILVLAGRFFTTEPPGKRIILVTIWCIVLNWFLFYYCCLFFLFFFFLRRYRIETANNSNHGEPSGIMEYIFCCVDNCWNQYIMQGVIISRKGWLNKVLYKTNFQYWNSIFLQLTLRSDLEKLM